MEPNEIVIAKISATVKILEWTKDAIEPGIGGNAQALHTALTEAFKQVYLGISEAVATKEVDVEVRAVAGSS
jgi:hypothetical protein